jgi:putative GTP pyrophosphokinase
MQKKHIPMDHIVEEMDDIAGIRIMCQFEEDIYKVVEIIRNRRDMSIREEKDYITNAKTSGYRSFHIILNYDVYTIKGLQTIQAEIQIRTMAMDFWASLEHKIYYKFEGNAPGYISRDLRECSDIVSMLDAKMLQLNEAIIQAKEAQEEQTGAV